MTAAVVWAWLGEAIVSSPLDFNAPVNAYEFNMLHARRQAYYTLSNDNRVATIAWILGAIACSHAHSLTVDVKGREGAAAVGMDKTHSASPAKEDFSNDLAYHNHVICLLHLNVVAIGIYTRRRVAAKTADYCNARQSAITQNF